MTLHQRHDKATCNLDTLLDGFLRMISRNVQEHDGTIPTRVPLPVLQLARVVDEVAQEAARVLGRADVLILPCTPGQLLIHHSPREGPINDHH